MSKEALKTLCGYHKRVEFSDNGEIAYLINDYDDPKQTQEKQGMKNMK